MIAHAKLMLPLDATRGTWDRADLWDLGGDCLLAFVADAPEKASQHTGKWIQLWLRDQAAALSGTLANLSGEDLRLVVADLLTGVGDHLVEQGRGSAYAACSLALYARGVLYTGAVGDCAAYLVPPGGPVRRLSDVTRAGGRSVLAASPPARPTAYAEGVYVGATSRLFPPAEVLALPVEGPALGVLVSDGAEAQLGVDGLAQRLLQHADPKSLTDAVRAELGSSDLLDDVTILAFSVAGAAEAGKFAKFSEELAEALGPIRQSLRAMESAQRSVAGSLVEIRHTVRSLADAAASDPGPASPHSRAVPESESAPPRALQHEMARLGDRLGRLERGLGTVLEALEEQAKPSANQPPRLPDVSYLWLGIGLLIFLQVGIFLAGGWKGQAVETAALPPAPTPSQQFLWVRRTCVELAYLPPSSVEAGGSGLEAAELERLLSEARLPERPFSLGWGLAVKHWPSLRRWSLHQVQVQRDQTWTTLAERFVHPVDRLRALNPKVRRNGKEIDNPGDKLAPRDIVQVPAFHFVLTQPDRGPGFEELLQRLGVGDAWIEQRDRILRRDVNGRPVLSAPLLDPSAELPSEAEVSGEFQEPAP